MSMLMPIEEVGSLLGGVTRSTIYRLLKKDPAFPRPIKIGSYTRFRRSDIEAYVNDQVDCAERNQNRRLETSSKAGKNTRSRQEGATQ